MVASSSLFALEKVGVQVLTCFCLFSLLTLFTSRDFCDNVFLVKKKRDLDHPPSWVYNFD